MTVITKRMDNLATYCTVGGLCYNLASQFLLKVPWDKVLNESLKASGRKVWSSRNAYALVLKEAQMAQHVFIEFRRIIQQIDQFQDAVSVNICSLSAAKEFIGDFEKVLRQYEPENITSWVTNVSGEPLRQQLQYYTVFMHAMMSTIMLDVSYVTMRLHAIQLQDDPQKKQEMLSDLKQTCSRTFPQKRVFTQNTSFEQPDEFVDANETFYSI